LLVQCCPMVKCSFPRRHCNLLGISSLGRWCVWTKTVEFSANNLFFLFFPLLNFMNGPLSLGYSSRLLFFDLLFLFLIFYWFLILLFNLNFFFSNLVHFFFFNFFLLLRKLSISFFNQKFYFVFFKIYSLFFSGFFF
jgi:hypothetical protein